MGEGLPALPINVRLILIILFIVANNIVAVWIILIELIVASLLSTLLIFPHDVIRIEHRFVLAFWIKSELLFASSIGLLSTELNHSFGELV